MQNVWLHFKACLNFAHTLVAALFRGFYRFTAPLPLLRGIFSPLVFVTSQQAVRVKGDLIVLTFLLQPQINVMNGLIPPPDELRVEVFYITRAPHRKARRFLSDCSVWSQGAAASACR